MSVDLTDDIIDSLNIIDRILELEQEMEEHKEAVALLLESSDDASLVPAADDVRGGFTHPGDFLSSDIQDPDNLILAWLTWELSNMEELETLREIEEKFGDCGYWDYGDSLIRDSHFPDYAKQLAEDCGMVTGSEIWPGNCIDWEEAARDLQQDYISGTIDGVVYWMRA